MIAVDVGVIISGATGLTASQVASASIIFPLRLGFACALGVPLQRVLAANVTVVSFAVVGPSVSIARTDPANTRYAACVASRVLAGTILYRDSNALRLTDRRVSAVAVSTTPIAAGSYIIVTLVILVDVPSTALDASAGNLTSIAQVASVVSSLSPLLPVTLVNVSNSTGRWGSAMSTALSGFVDAVAAAAGVPSSSLAVGGEDRDPAVSVDVPGSRGSTLSTVSESAGGPNAGVIAGIVIGLLVLAILIAIAVLMWKHRMQPSLSEPGTSTQDASGQKHSPEVSHMHDNPMRATGEKPTSRSHSSSVDPGKQLLNPLTVAARAKSDSNPTVLP